MVAKSYQGLKLAGDPYVKDNGKMYVQVVKTNGSLKEVRWYNAIEYAKMYPGEPIEEQLFSNEKHLLGFQEGYITIFKGDQEKYEWWFNHSVARYCTLWGWYIVSTDCIPVDLPAGLTPVELKWEQIGCGDALNRECVRSVVDSLLYGSHPSVFQGGVGERLDLTVTVIKAEKKEKYFGGKSSTNTIHTFEDSCGNHYVWDTGAKNWSEGATKRIRATVKEHKVINNIQTTVLTRCLEQMK